MTDPQYETVIYVGIALLAGGVVTLFFPALPIAIFVGCVAILWALVRRQIERGHSLWTMKPK